MPDKRAANTAVDEPEPVDEEMKVATAAGLADTPGKEEVVEGATVDAQTTHDDAVEAPEETKITLEDAAIPSEPEKLEVTEATVVETPVSVKQTPHEGTETSMQEMVEEMADPDAVEETNLAAESTSGNNVDVEVMGKPEPIGFAVEMAADIEAIDSEKIDHAAVESTHEESSDVVAHVTGCEAGEVSEEMPAAVDAATEEVVLKRSTIADPSLEEQTATLVKGISEVADVGAPSVDEPTP